MMNSRRAHRFFAVALASIASAGTIARAEGPAIITHTLAARGDAASYDEAMAAATLQGIINRDSPRVYIRSNANKRPDYWLEILRRPGGWLEVRGAPTPVDLDALVELAREHLRGAVIWDPAVPATVNVATTVAGVEDAVVLSPELAESRLKAWKLPILIDLRNRFDGKETGSKKNDAYRWAVREYLDKGRCSSHRLLLNEDAATLRAVGGLGDVVTRDWAVKNRSFVFDLSPWGDEVPGDDPGQRLGLDLETYRLILDSVARHAAGRELTELAGFFSFAKYAAVPGHASRHDPVPTEWETVRLISPFGCYQNTVTGDSFNQSFHSQAPRKPLAQRRPPVRRGPGDTTYIAMFMADYDSTMPLYEILPPKWDSPARGKLPLAWGINPNLVESYPDLIAHYYATASPNDLFTADASAAGYL
ncbi:GxGYxYP domain-containing protein [Paludisphaera mucosa]|uniref:GxGYxYP family putative glycoside hydrolase n=1 Tax=Paludisphaera mucosa TaxID=3030827 RepID=A0ABT6F6L4_9BACT|nr:GxGYxYP domain-containing protein [Paludisphaera mucosa]MDG3003167.1 GxGYxYP family putative glycoside hydrolase [Paludisphaera mucosa]